MKCKFILLLLLFSLNIAAQELVLKNAILSDFGKTQRTEEQKTASRTITEVLKNNGLEGHLSLAYTNIDDGNLWYRLFDDMKIYGVNVETKQYLGGWPLGVPDVCQGKIDTETEVCSSPWWTGRWGSDEVLESEVIDTYKKHFFNWKEMKDYNSDPVTMGCMQQHPLRYGDLEGDGTKELVLFLEGGYSVDFIVFSTVKHKTIFSSKLDNNDAVSYEAAAASKDLSSSIPEKAEKKYQFFNRTNIEEGSIVNSRNIKGMRALAKLYFGHFSNDNSNDILVWRKLYFSRLLSDPIKGFETKSEILVHYKLVDGEYKKQATDSATVKGWLTAKQLTWKKGYPSKSECAGQEGQFIPEMHDVLLNDPDVLQ